MTAKRVREPKYKDFGELLETWRNKRDIEVVVRLVRQQGVEFDAATLRGWEYGWTGRPDPLRLLALARVYGRSVDDVMLALAAARGMSESLRRDLIRHVGTKTSALPSTGGAADVVAAQTRIRELEARVQALEAYEAIVRTVRPLLNEAIAAVGKEGGATARAETKRRRRHRNLG